MANFAVEIKAAQTISGNQPRANRIIEEAGQTFNVGVPVEVKTADGGIEIWNGATTTAGIAGIAYEGASNLGSTGLGAPVPFQPVTGMGTTVTFRTVVNEASAVNIPHGAPINDGRIGLYLAAGDTVFSAAFGLTGTATKPLATDVGVAYGMTKDTGNNYWYVDKAKTGASAVLTVIGLDKRDVAAAGTRVLFTFLPASAQITA